MKTKSKTSKATTKKTAAKTPPAPLSKRQRAAKFNAKAFKIDPDLKKNRRGKEFLFLQENGLTYSQIIVLYKQRGNALSAPTIYGAMKIAEAPEFIHQAIDQGKIKASAVLALMEGAGSQKEIAQRLKDMVQERKQRVAMLKQNGFSGTKMSKTRTVAIVLNSLQEIRKSGSLKSAGQKAVLEVLDGLRQNKTAEELLAMISR